MHNLKVWISIASSTGLSVVSLGTPGLKEDLDEQVFTGGISAVTQLLSTEIGSNEKSFIGGGDTRKMGRFVVQNPKDKSREVITQFLIMSTDENKIQEEFISYIQEIAINFASNMISSSKWNEVEKGFKTLSALEVFDTLIDSIIFSRKKHKINLSDEPFNKKVKYYVTHTFKSAEYFDVLNSITELEPTWKDLNGMSSKKINGYLDDLFNEILTFILDDDPSPILVKNKPREIIDDINVIFNKFVSQNVSDFTKNELLTIMNEIFGGDIADILKNFNVLEMRELHSRIHAALANEVVLRISKRNPVLLLVNPSLNSNLANSFNDYINENVEAVYQEYDLASILGKITSLLLEGEDPISTLLISEFIRGFAMRFPAGLSNHAWKFIHTSFNMFSKISANKTNVKTALDSLDISSSHLATINSFLKSIKPSNDLKSMRFTITKEGEEIIQFFNILQQVIIEGSQNFFNEVIFSSNQLGIFTQKYAEKIDKVVRHTQHLNSLLLMLKFIYSNKTFEYLITDDYLPSLEDLADIAGDKIEHGDSSANKNRFYFWKPKFMSEVFAHHSLKLLKSEITVLTETFVELETKLQEIVDKTFKKNKNASKPKKVNVSPEPMEKDKFRSFAFIRSQYRELIKYYNETLNLIQNINQATDAKKLLKALDELKKGQDRYLKRSKDIKKKLMDQKQKYEKNIEKESQKLHRDLVKIFSNSIIHEYNIKENKNREEFLIPNLSTISTQITSKIEENPLLDSLFPKNEDLIYTFASIVIFNKLPRNIFNDILNTTILTGGKGSDIINEMISEMKLKSSAEVDYLFIEDHLRKSIRIAVEKRIKLVFEIILGTINEAYFKGVVRSYPVNSAEFGEISCIDIGEFNYPFIIEKLKKGLNLFGEDVHTVEIEDKYHVFYELERFPSSGSRFPITKAIVQGTWNNVIGDQAGLYLELLKMSSELLGESRRRKFQEFLEKIFQIID